MSYPFLPDDVVYNLACAPGTQMGQTGICLAGCTSGLYRSLDGGMTWLDLYDRLAMRADLPVSAVAFSPQFDQDQTLFAAVAGNVFRSDDAGETWNGVFIASPLPTISCFAVSPHFIQDKTLFVGTVEDGIFESNDRGNRWKQVNVGLLNQHVLALAISPDYARSPYLLAGTEGGLFRSKNGGRAWREITLPGNHDPVLSLAFSPNFAQDKLAYAGTESKTIFSTADRGNSWRVQAADLPGAVSWLYPLKNARLAALLDVGLFVESADGSWLPWNPENQIEGISAAAVLDQDPPVALVGCLGSNFYRVERK